MASPGWMKLKWLRFLRSKNRTGFEEHLLYMRERNNALMEEKQMYLHRYVDLMGETVRLTQEILKLREENAQLKKEAAKVADRIEHEV